MVTFFYIIQFMKTTNYKAKEAVRLRTKLIKNGNQSLYLDIYHKGQRRYEFLHIYLIPERNREDRIRNRHSLDVAHRIRNRRLAELQETIYTDRHTLHKHRSNLIDYIDTFCAARKSSYRSLSLGLKQHLIYYKGPVIPFSCITKSFLSGFHHYLNQAPARGNVAKHHPRLLSQCTKWNYFNIFSRLLNKAAREGYLLRNPMHDLSAEDRPRRAEPRKTYLVIQEIRRLAATPLKRHPEVKQAFLFACLCGLRFSDVKRLQWNNLQTDSRGFTTAEIIQKKTGSRLYLPLSAEALKQLPCDTEREGLVFKHLPDASYTSKLLKRWGQAANISKHVTFHVSRHTFATLSLTYGVDLYTISKLLGHSNIRVTQVYADIISEKKREAVDAIPTIVE